MGDTLVALYKKPAQAESAMQELIAHGIQQYCVRAEPDHSGGAAGITQENVFDTVFQSDQEMAAQYRRAVAAGLTLVTVSTDNDVEGRQALDILSRHEPVDLDAVTEPVAGTDADEDFASAGTQGAATEPTTQDAGIRIPVVQEQVTVGKRQVERGGVRVMQRVVDAPARQDVALNEERITVERRPLDEPAISAGLSNFEEGTFEMRESIEVPVVDKTARVVEEVVINKEASQRTESVDATERRTDVHVEQVPPTGKSLPTQSR